MPKQRKLEDVPWPQGRDSLRGVSFQLVSGFTLRGYPGTDNWVICDPEGYTVKFVTEPFSHITSRITFANTWVHRTFGGQMQGKAEKRKVVSLKGKIQATMNYLTTLVNKLED